MQLTFVIADLAMKVLDRHVTSGGDLPSRLQLCAQILNEWKQLKGMPPHQTFSEGFVAARRDCKNSLTTSGTRGSAEDSRPLLNTAGRLKLASFGQAEGPPNSPERRQQLEKTWELNMPDLHVVYPHEEANRERWIDSFMRLQPRQFCYLTVLGQLDVTNPDEYMRRLLIAFRPEGAPEGWIEDKVQRGKAIVKAGLWIHTEAEKQNDKKKRLRVKPFRDAHDLQGSYIGIVDSLVGE